MVQKCKEPNGTFYMNRERQSAYHQVFVYGKTKEPNLKMIYLQTDVGKWRSAAEVIRKEKRWFENRSST